jgi:ring-1,2-phenylacetyl-CoA epoxidase subunit PaaE
MSHDFKLIRIAQVQRETADTISVVLDVPESMREEFTFKPGQHLTLRTFLNDEEVRRTYSLCAAPHERVWRVAIKQLPGGRFSNWANLSLHSGDHIDVLPPSGSFTWAFDEARRARYAMFASGSGITPILSLLKAGLESEPHSHFSLFYGNRDSDNVLFLDEIADLKDQYIRRLSVHHFFSREEDELAVFNGRIDRPKMALLTQQMLDVGRLDGAFACGPQGMMDAVETALTEAGLEPHKILTERFGTTALTADQQAAIATLEARAAGKRMKITLDGRSRMIAFDPERKSILDNARAAGLRTPFSCKAGVCATCRARVTQGQVEMIRNFGLSPTEVEEGYILTCQAVPLSDDVEVDFDQ